jgi:glucokinase-like ROK family protein
MHYLRENAPISRASLAELTGLNKTTVSSLVRELIDRQFVQEVGLESPGTGRGAGRRAMMLTLDPRAGFIVSCEIGVDFITVICTNFDPVIIWRHNELIDPGIGRHAIIERVLAFLNQGVIEGSKTCNNLLGIAIGVPGLVDQESGTLLFAPNLGWQDIPLKVIFQESFATPVVIDNEASLAALGEQYFGAAQGYNEVLYISAGVGLGGGIVHGGGLFYGAAGFAGEFGHMTMIPGGELCSCGNRGCWETLVSQIALFRDIRREIHKGRESMLLDITNGSLDRLTVPIVVEAANNNDQLALDSLKKIGHHLGSGISSLVNGLNPELVVLGGILSIAGDYLLPIVQEELDKRALRWNRQTTEVVIAHHGYDACVMGGVAKIYQDILAEPDNIERQGTLVVPVQALNPSYNRFQKEVNKNLNNSQKI